MAEEGNQVSLKPPVDEGDHAEQVKAEDALQQDANDDRAPTSDIPSRSESPKRESSVKQKTILRQGYLKVKEGGQVVYKKTASQAIMAATQLGIGYSVGRLSAKPERDVLMVDFYFVEKVWFPAQGSKETPSHKYDDFRFKTYAPVAFRFFRDLFNILPSDFLISLANETIREISNPGASGSLFFVSNDDLFIVKTVQKKEATFLQQLLPGYYMNLHQNPRTLLPKFFGLYCFQSGSSNIRLTVMNNLLPSQFKCHFKFDLKGSTYKRKANKLERAKKSPTYKDLDYLELFPEGILLDAPIYDVVIKTISRDVRVLESFQIMDYSFLLGVHNLDEAERDGGPGGTASKAEEPLVTPEQAARRNEFGAALEAIQVKDGEDVRPIGGVNAKTVDGQRLILFIGIIDILQSYRFMKKAEHRWKSMFMADGDTVSVHNPSFYAKRFLDFIKNSVFKRIAPMQRGPSKRKSGRIPNSVSLNVPVPVPDPSLAGAASPVPAGAVPPSKASGSNSSWGVSVENSTPTSRKVFFAVPDRSEDEAKDPENPVMHSSSVVTTDDVVVLITDRKISDSGPAAVESDRKALVSNSVTIDEGNSAIRAIGNGDLPRDSTGIPQ